MSRGGVGEEVGAAGRGVANAAASSGVPPILYVLAAALLWSTGGLFIKATPELSAYELSFGRSLLAALTVAYFTRREGFRVNWVTVVAAALYAALLLLFVMATKLTTAANAIFLQYTAPVYILIFEPLVFKEKYRRSDFLVVAACAVGIALFFVGRLRPEEMQGNLLALVSGALLRSLHAAHTAAARGARQPRLLHHLRQPAARGRLRPLLLRRDAQGQGGGRRRHPLPRRRPDRSRLHALYARASSAACARSTRALIGYVEPLSNPVWVYLFLGERPSGWAILGGTIIITAVLAHTVALTRRGKKETNG